MYKLTIGIPTYNRVELLKKSLISLENIDHNIIEVIVSDNASTDGTKEFMIDYCKDHEYIKYYSNKINKGPDLNFKSILDKSNGIYTLILSDDDELEVFKIDQLIYFLEQSRNLGVVFLNTGKSDNKIFNFETPKIYDRNNFFDFFDLVKIYVTFISIIVFKTDYYKKISNKEKFLSSSLFQTGVIFQILSQDEVKAAIFPNLLISATTNQKLSYDFNEIFIQNLYSIIMSSESFKILNKKQIRLIFKRYLKFVLKFNYLIKTNRIASKLSYSKEVKKILFNFKLEFFFLSLIIYSPTFILNFFYNTYRILKFR
jgi:glycosyltransferase involved in cell wall biosynthesis